MENDWIIKIIDVGYKTEKDIYIFRVRYDGKKEMLGGEVFEVDTIPTKPTLSLTDDQLRGLAQEISKQGMNPQKEFVEGKLEATEKHLADMRKLLKLK